MRRSTEAPNEGATTVTGEPTSTPGPYPAAFEAEAMARTPSTPASHLVLPHVAETDNAYSHIPEHGFSLFLANRTKTIHFIRHAEGQHNEVNRQAGNDSPVTYSTSGAWEYQDAKLTPTGIQQCLDARKSEKFAHVHPELVIVSPFTRTLQTAHILFGGQRIPFMVHDLCRERSGKYTCDKRRTTTEILKDVLPMYEQTNDATIDVSYGYPTEEDLYWSEERESSESVIQRCIDFIQWLASRPEREVAVVTHSSWLKHLFRHDFGPTAPVVAEKDQEELHRLAGNAEIRSVCLALHRGFYPQGTWDTTDSDTFVPNDPSFRRGRWAPTNNQIASMHKRLLMDDSNM